MPLTARPFNPLTRVAFPVNGFASIQDALAGIPQLSAINTLAASANASALLAQVRS